MVIEQRTFEGKEQVEIPNLKLYNEVFSSIQSALDPKRAEKLTPQDILFPSILVLDDFSSRTVLAEVGFPDGLPVIVIGNNPSLFKDIATEESSKFMLGDVFKGEEHVLLLRIGESRVHASSLVLPKNWKSVVQGGKLMAKPTEPTKIIIEEDPSKLFSEIKKALRNFPDGSCPNTQVAKFGKQGTSVEIQTEEREITFLFANLDFEKFRKLCRSRTLNLDTFAGCFRNGYNDDRFSLTVALDAENNLQVQGQILRWDFVSSRLTNSLPYLGPDYPAYLEMIEGVIEDRVRTLPYFLSQLKKPDRMQV